MPLFEIWCEGYQATGNAQTAQLMGSQEAENFQQACNKWSKTLEQPEYYDAAGPAYWGCRLFDNMVDARKSFG